MTTTETTTIVIDGTTYELPTIYTISDVCQGITVTLHRPAVVQAEGTIEKQEEGKQ